MVRCRIIYIALHNGRWYTQVIECTPEQGQRQGHAMKNGIDRSIKSTINAASDGVQQTVSRAEIAALSAVGRVEDTMATVKVGLDQAKAFGTEVFSVVDNAGRTTLGGIATVNTSLVGYGRDVLADTIDVGKKTMEARSVQDVVELQTAFAERRISAAFHTMAALNSLAQQNVMAMFTPFASLVRETAGTTEGSMKEFVKPVAVRAEAVQTDVIKSVPRKAAPVKAGPVKSGKAKAAARGRAKSAA